MQMAAAAQDAVYGFVFLYKFSDLSISLVLIGSMRYSAQTYVCKQSLISSSYGLEVWRKKGELLLDTDTITQHEYSKFWFPFLWNAIDACVTYVSHTLKAKVLHWNL